MPKRLSNRWVKEESAALMNRFCAPDRPEIVSVDRSSTPVGSNSTYIGMGITSTDTNFRDDTFVRFTCEPHDMAFEP